MPRTRSQKISPEISLNDLELLTPRRRRRTLKLANNGNKSEINGVCNQPLALNECSKLQNIDEKHLSDESPIAYVSLLSSDTSLDISSSFDKSNRRRNHSRKSKQSCSIKKSLRKSLHFDVGKENESNNSTNNNEFEEEKSRSRHATKVLEPNCYENEIFEEHAFSQKSRRLRSSTFSPETPKFKHEKETDIELNCFGNEYFRKHGSVGILDNNNQPTSSLFSSEVARLKDKKTMGGCEDKLDANLIYSPEKKDATFSPESPHFKYQDAFDIANSVKLSEADRDVSRNSLKYKTSTPFKSDNIENLIENTRLDSSNVERTPKSIIKQNSKRQSLDKISNRLSRSNIEISTNNKKTHITTRKKKSISDTEIDTSLIIPKKARVTFHPNTSVFRIDVIDSSPSLDNCSVTMQDETSSVVGRKQTPYNRRMTRILGSDPLNDQKFEASTTKNTLQKGTTPAKLNRTDTTTIKSLIKARRILEKDNSTPHLKNGAKLNKKTPKGFSSKKVPDFSSIHKKNFDKMESLHDHVHRKIERAKNLFGRPGPSVDNKENKEKVSKVPETLNNSTYSRFGFNIKATQNKKEQLKEQIQKKQIVNRDVTSIRNQRREYVKGVRSNRRFDLLMKARANEKK